MSDAPKPSVVSVDPNFGTLLRLRSPHQKGLIAIRAGFAGCGTFQANPDYMIGA